MIQAVIKFVQGVILVVVLMLIVGLLDFICNPLKYIH